jgi:hypothetical protein
MHGSPFQRTGDEVLGLGSYDDYVGEFELPVKLVSSLPVDLTFRVPTRLTTNGPALGHPDAVFIYTTTHWAIHPPICHPQDERFHEFGDVRTYKPQR